MRFGRALPLCLLLLACAKEPAPPGPAAAVPAGSDLRVFVVVIDGLGPGRVRPSLMPELCRIAHCPGTPRPDQDSHATIYAEARAAMVAQTNPNHVAMMTGAHGDVSGAVANSFYNRAAKREEALDRSALILSPTLFDVLGGVRKTAVVAGKEKLRRLFDCTRAGGACGASRDNPEGVPVRHAAPDFLMGAAQKIAAGSGDCQAIPSVSRGVAVDACIMDLAVKLSDREDPAFVLINLARVDQAQHTFGPGSAAVHATIAAADLEIGRLVAYLKGAGKWDSTVLFVLSDHSFSDLRQAPGHRLDLGAVFLEDRRRNPEAWGPRGGIDESFTVVPGGGVAQVYLTSVSASAEAWTPAQADALARMRHLALSAPADASRPGISEALYRLPNPRDPGHAIGAVHPGWALGSARAGDLVVAALARGPSRIRPRRARRRGVTTATPVRGTSPS
ncbi:MAG: alkaline phosphatase family protein [Myxococcota bacterium]